MNPLFEKLDRLGLKPLYDPNELPVVGPADVENLESRFGYSIPPIYKEFLLRYGLSMFDGYASFDVPSNWSEVTENGHTNIAVFYGLVSNREPDERTLSDLIGRDSSIRFPAHFLPICSSDSPSTVVFISCQNQDYGHVYALSRTQIWDLESPEHAASDAFHIADSFEAFLNNLNILTEAEYNGADEPAPLFDAMEAGDVAYLQKMVDAGEMTTYRSEYNLTLFECAIVSRLAWPVEFLLQHDSPVGRGLWLAIQNGCVDAVRQLIAHGADVNQIHPVNTGAKEWRSLLIQAVRIDDYDNKYEIAQLLVEAGADPEIRDSEGKIALDYVHPLNQKMRGILTRK